MNNKTLIVTSSKSNSRDLVKTDLGQSLLFQSQKYFDLQYVQNDGEKSLASIYNGFLTEYTANHYEIVVFVHDDVSIQDSMLFTKLDQAIGDESDYSICGVAGAVRCKPQKTKPCLWHMMCHDGQFKDASGAVGHYVDDKVIMTNFGVVPQRVILLDGLFLAVNIRKVLDAGVKFDEECPSKFHFYDLNFCLEANKNSLKMKTIPLWVVHRSHGLSEFDDEFKKGNEYFYNKWGK